MWHEPTKRWVMAVYTESDQRQSIAFHTSSDLKQWTYQSRIDGYFECPDLFELPVQGTDSTDKPQTKCVLYAADGLYVLGEFDGTMFHAETDKLALWHGNFYAAQTFSNAPDGRRIQIGWARGVTFPGMPFNQQMTVPVELTLRQTGAGPRMFAEPVRELESLRGRKYVWPARTLPVGETPLDGVEADLLDIQAELEPPAGGSVGLVIRGTRVEYDARERELRCRDAKVPLEPISGAIHLRILVDRGSLEIFANRGRAALSIGTVLPDDNRTISAFARGDNGRVTATIIELNSAWPQQPMDE